jgi:hypothetical protein
MSASAQCFGGEAVCSFPSIAGIVPRRGIMLLGWSEQTAASSHVL